MTITNNIDLRKEFPNGSADFLKANGVDPGVFKDTVNFIDRSIPSKYHAVRTGHYHSKKEARYADTLELRRKAGEISFWLEQTPFRLPGDIIYRLDFVVFTGNAGIYEVDWVEVKGKDLALGKLKRKQVEDLYGIKITVV